MQEFVFIYILLAIFLIMGVVIIWELNKKIFQIVAEDPEKLAHLSFDYASKLGIKTVAGIKKFWESIIGKKIVNFGIIERRPYGKNISLKPEHSSVKIKGKNTLLYRLLRLLKNRV